ncbi:MAG: histidine phosphatase family protein [Candidatus Vogelbacteria bacterium]|nr:histidine phosphatase family protein [Candidatus Vogelbacteria bacterium]
MPKRFVLVRHGFSEGNAAKKLINAGADPKTILTPEFLNRHSKKFRLTDLGRRQAIVTGRWIKRNIAKEFDRYFVSEYLRALETAALLNFKNAEWRKDFNLRERDYGLMDMLSPEQRERCYLEEMEIYRKDKFLMPIPGGGESIANLCLRVWSVFDRLHREASDEDVCMVVHGEFMWACRVLLERIPMETYHELDSSKEPFDRIHNCQVLEYTRINPFTGEETDCYKWMRSVCPSNLKLSRNEWVEIKRRKYSNKELLDEVNASQRFLK